MTQPRIFDDGTLAYPQRGNPPADRPGYIRDPGNVYHLLLVVLPCANRETEQRPCNCPGGGTLSFAACKLGIVLKAGTCNACDKRVAPADPINWEALQAQTDPTADWLGDFISGIADVEVAKVFMAYLAESQGSWAEIVQSVQNRMAAYLSGSGESRLP